MRNLRAWFVRIQGLFGRSRGTASSPRNWKPTCNCTWKTESDPA